MLVLVFLKVIDFYGFGLSSLIRPPEPGFIKSTSFHCGACGLSIGDVQAAPQGNVHTVQK